MQERRFSKQKINELTQEYIQTKDEKALEKLLLELDQIIQIQVAKRYPEFFDHNLKDFKQDIFLRLWESLLKNPGQLEKYKNHYQWFWYRIKNILNREVYRMKSQTRGKGYDSLNNGMVRLDHISRREKKDFVYGNDYATELDKTLKKAEDVFDVDTIPLNESGRSIMKIEELFSIEEIIEHISKTDKDNDIAKICALIGPEMTAVLAMEFSGERVYFPERSSLWRVVMEMTIKKELGKLDPNSEEFTLMRKELQQVFGMTKAQVLETLNKKD